MIQRKETRPPQPFEEPRLAEQRAPQPPAHLLSGVKQIVVRFGSGPEKPILVTLNKEIKGPTDHENPRKWSILFPFLLVLSMWLYVLNRAAMVAASLEGKYTNLLTEHCARDPAFVSLVRLLFGDHTRLAPSKACFIEFKKEAGQTVCYYVWHPTTQPPSPPRKPGASSSSPPPSDLVIVLKIVLRNPTERTPSFTVARTSVSIRQKRRPLSQLEPSFEINRTLAYPGRWLRNCSIGPKLDSDSLQEYAQGRKGKK